MRSLTINFKIIIVCIVFVGLSTAVSAQSFVPSAQQIQQFKNLPRAQQEALARQMGFDVSILDQVSNSNGSKETSAQKAEVIEREVDEKQISEGLSRQSIVQERSKKLKPFGYSLFNSEQNSFEPLSNIPVPSDYAVGPGDSFTLKLFGKETGTFELVVNNEGTIDIPDLGPVNVIGLSYQEVKSTIEQKYQQQKIGVQPFVSMGTLRTIQVFMVGEVFRPGSLTVSSLSTISTALFNSGGVGDIGSLRNIELKRAGKTVANFDLYDLMVRGDVSQDIRLQQGDVIFVPLVNNLVSIDGEVRRPAIYELKQNESLTTLIELAGGFLPSADVNSVQIVRNEQQNGLSIKTLNAASQNANAFNLLAGDYVNVQKANLEFVDAIRVRGNINSPRLVSNQQKQNLSDIVTESALLKGTDLDYALVVRKPKFSTNSEIYQFKPIEVLNEQFDMSLKAFDEVIFFSRYTDEALTSEASESVAKRNVRATGGDGYDRDNQFLANELERSFTKADVATSDTSAAAITRKALLAPVLAQLRSEASENNPLSVAEINGQVRYPGIYPIAKNKASLEALIYAAGGLTEAAHLEEAEISKFETQDGVAVTRHISVNLIKQLTSKVQEQYMLSSKDVVKIARIPDWYESNTVELKGEFVFPGKYQISKGESLASVIARAGGLTAKATPEAAVFMRQELKERERNFIEQSVSDLKQQLANNNLSSSQFTKTIDYENASLILNELTDVELLGRLVIDFPKLISGVPSADIELKDGDVLVVPNITPAISVIGEVFVPTTHQLDNNNSIEDYIEASGGVREYADKDKVYVVRANGSVFVPEANFWFMGSNDSKILQPGDTIVVPRDVTNYENLSVWQGVTQIIYQTAVALAAIGSL